MSYIAPRLIIAGAILLAIAAVAAPREASFLEPAAQAAAAATPPPAAPAAAARSFDTDITDNVRRMIDEGRRVFRYDTFGDEAFWGDQLQLHKAIVGQKLGGVGPGLSPKAALALGLKVDAEAVPGEVAAGIKSGKVDLNDPASTVALLKANAVVGVTAFLNPDGSARSVGIQCALCHSTVDDSFAPGIGKRLDGWPNRDLNVGEIVALAPSLKPFSDLLGVDEAGVRKVLKSWGPGKYDAELVQDGKAQGPGGRSAATVLPAAPFGLAGVNLHSRFPIAAKAGHGNIRNADDRITPKLAALHFYQLAIPAPAPPAGSFNAASAGRGKALFEGRARCASCHVPPLYTEPGYAMHKPEEIGIDNFQAERSPDQQYRTTPLRGLSPGRRAASTTTAASRRSTRWSATTTGTSS